jgi:hypothetical protein
VPHEHESNNLVLGVLLDIVFRMNMFFGMPRSATKPYWELASRIERGVDELTKLQVEGDLNQHLMIDTPMGNTVKEILESGTCKVLENLEARIDRMAKTELSTDIQASPDEFV